MCLLTVLSSVKRSLVRADWWIGALDKSGHSRPTFQSKFFNINMLDSM